MNTALFTTSRLRTAGKIAVGPSFATSCADTVCASFKPKEF